MIYIRYEEKKYGFFEKMFIRFKKLKTSKLNGQDIITLNDVSKISLEKLSKIFKINCTSLICISESLMNNNDFISFIDKENIYYFKGIWLYNYLLTNIIEYISLNKKEKIENQEVSILTNDINDNIIYEIKEIAYRVKVVNIVSNKQKMFYKLEQELYEKNGITININNDYNKTLKKSNIIINYDFSEQEFNKYEISKTACIININNKIKITKKSFSGINIQSYNINFPERYDFLGMYKNEFNKNVLYESIIYKRTLARNIRKELENDKISIVSLNGLNGIIRKNEFSKISKKI